MTPPVRVRGPAVKSFVSKRFDAIRHTLKSKAISTKGTESITLSFLFSVIFLFFKWLPSTLKKRLESLMALQLYANYFVAASRRFIKANITSPAMMHSPISTAQIAQSGILSQSSPGIELR